MEVREFLVQGSEDDPYVIEFVRKGKQLAASCTCAAGSLGQLCKHRLGVLTGDVSKLDLVSGSEHLADVAAWRQDSFVGTVLDELARLDQEMLRLKQEHASRKKQLGRMLNEYPGAVGDR